MAHHIPDGDFVDYMTGRSLWLRRVAYLLCQDWHQADDLAQTAMTKLYAQWPRACAFDHLDAYLRTILVNTYLSESRNPGGGGSLDDVVALGTNQADRSPNLVTGTK